MVLVSRGTFVMGSDHESKNERPIHGVTLTRTFYIDRTEVTTEAFGPCVLAGACALPGKVSLCNPIGDPNLALDFTRVLHGSQEYEYRRPLREGETLHIVARIGSIRRKGENAFLTVVMDMFGDDGALAATATSVMIERAAG
jgi:hypothetical protein